MHHLPSALILAIFLSFAMNAGSQTAPCNSQNILPKHQLHPNSEDFTKPPFHVDVERDGKSGTRLILTNEYRLPLTAFVEEITPVPDGQEGGVEHGFYLVDGLEPSGDLMSPIPLGLSTIRGVSHNAGRADAQLGVAAVVWEDGLTYGPDNLVQRIVARRRLSSEYHQHAIDLLETGLKEGWDANRYVSVGRAREEEWHAMSVDRELNLIVELPLQIVVDNLMRVQRENPGNADRMAKMLLKTQLRQKEVVDAGLAAMAGSQTGTSTGCMK